MSLSSSNSKNYGCTMVAMETDRLIPVTIKLSREEAQALKGEAEAFGTTRSALARQRLTNPQARYWRFLVPGSNEAVYAVTCVDDACVACTCPAFTYHGNCKHILLVGERYDLHCPTFEVLRDLLS